MKAEIDKYASAMSVFSYYESPNLSLDLQEPYLHTENNECPITYNLITNPCSVDCCGRTFD